MEREVERERPGKRRFVGGEDMVWPARGNDDGVGCHRASRVLKESKTGHPLAPSSHNSLLYPKITTPATARFPLSCPNLTNDDIIILGFNKDRPKPS
jgi:hypothetical protein